MEDPLKTDLVGINKAGSDASMSEKEKPADPPEITKHEGYFFIAS